MATYFQNFETSWCLESHYYPPFRLVCHHIPMIQVRMDCLYFSFVKSANWISLMYVCYGHFHCYLANSHLHLQQLPQRRFSFGFEAIFTFFVDFSPYELATFGWHKVTKHSYSFLLYFPSLFCKSTRYQMYQDYH